MKTRILFFDDEPQTCGRLKSALEERGYHICEPKSAEEAFHEINAGGAELLIHSAHRTQTSLENLFSYLCTIPKFPTLHFCDGTVRRRPRRSNERCVSSKIKTADSEKDFLKRVRKMIFIGRLKRERRVSPSCR